jgi:hypothetical protein
MARARNVIDVAVIKDARGISRAQDVRSTAGTQEIASRVFLRITRQSFRFLSAIILQVLT